MANTQAPTKPVRGARRIQRCVETQQRVDLVPSSLKRADDVSHEPSRRKEGWRGEATGLSADQQRHTTRRGKRHIGTLPPSLRCSSSLVPLAGRASRAVRRMYQMYPFRRNVHVIS